MILGALVLEWFFPHRRDPSAASPTPLVPPVFALIFWPTAILLMAAYLVWSVRNRYARLVRENPSAQIVRAVELTASGVTMSQPSRSASWTWDAFSELVESDRVFALRIKGDKQFLLIPKRAVPATQHEPLRSLVQAKTELEVTAFPVIPAPNAAGGDNAS
jgi:hypothetical protein